MMTRLIDQFPARRLSGAGMSLLAVLSMSGCAWHGSRSKTFGEGEYDLAVVCPPHHEENIEKVNLVESDPSDIIIDCRSPGDVSPPISVRRVYPPLTADNIVQIGYDYGENGEQHPELSISNDSAASTIELSGISQVTYVDQTRALQN